MLCQSRVCQPAVLAAILLHRSAESTATKLLASERRCRYHMLSMAGFSLLNSASMPCACRNFFGGVAAHSFV